MNRNGARILLAALGGITVGEIVLAEGISARTIRGPGNLECSEFSQLVANESRHDMEIMTSSWLFGFWSAANLFVHRYEGKTRDLNYELISFSSVFDEIARRCAANPVSYVYLEAFEMMTLFPELDLQ